MRNPSHRQYTTFPAIDARAGGTHDRLFKGKWLAARAHRWAALRANARREKASKYAWSPSWRSHRWSNNYRSLCQRGGLRPGYRFRKPTAPSGDARPKPRIRSPDAGIREQHPECPLWTNWEKLCSRTWIGGAIHCNRDPGRPVAPSTPFCARPTTEIATWPASERGSYNRFCSNPLGRLDGELAIDDQSGPRCNRWRSQRPFNGRRISALRHPGCEFWREVGSGRPICSEGNNAGAEVPHCSALAAINYEHSRELVCGEWIGPSSCRAYPVESGDRGDDFVVFDDDPNSRGVHGIYCENS